MVTATQPSFAVSLVCPYCQEQLPCSHIALEDYKGIPRTLFGQRYWGEVGSEDMRRILDLLPTTHWRAAVRAVVGEGPLYDHLTTLIRADCVHSLPWGEIRDVLDVGSGMGFLASDLAAYARKVVALEAVPERAEFLRARAAQDKLNIWPIIADAAELPFPAESFDLITLNGVLEYAGLWIKGDPKAAQVLMLKSLHRCLRPGGYLYVGIESRFGWTYYFGQRDHSGMGYTSLMPRWLADLYCRWRQKPFYGSEHFIPGYRTYTHTPNQYRRMFESAGLEKVQVLGVLGGYNEQKMLYDLDHYRVRRYAQERFNAPVTFIGRLRRPFTENRLTYKVLEPEVAILGRKSPATGEAFWNDFAPPVVQLNTKGKTLVLTFKDGKPWQLFQGPKTRLAAERMDIGYIAVTKAQQLFGAVVGSWRMRWPKPCGVREINGKRFYGYEFVEGWDVPSHAGNFRTDTFDLVTRVMNEYPTLCKRLGEAWHQVAADWGAWEYRFQNLNDEFRPKALAALKIAERWRSGAMHGDLSLNNLIASGDQLILLDWDMCEPFIPAVDLIRFAFDVVSDSHLLSAGKRRALLNHVRTTLTAALEKEGFSVEDYPALHTLFLAHQVLSAGSVLGYQRPIIERYRIDGPLSVLPSL